MRAGRVFAIFLLAFIFSGCGYHIVGKGGTMPGMVKTLTIPVFANQTPKPDIEGQMTSAFVTEFVTTLPVADDGEATLSGAIKSYTLNPVSFNRNDVNQEYRLTVVLSVRLLRGETVLWQDDNFSDYEDFTVNINDITATKDRESDAFRKISKDSARLVKERMLEAF